MTANQSPTLHEHYTIHYDVKVEKGRLYTSYADISNLFILILCVFYGYILQIYPPIPLKLKQTGQ